MLLTIFTPTYNRAHLLPRVYKHLCQQTHKDFLWLIIDDGSTDNTEVLVRSWITEACIKIEYYKHKNGGKMRAHNRAVELARTDLFLCLDSDDFLTENAVYSIVSAWNNIAEDDHFRIAGLIAYKGKDYEQTMNGESFPDIEETTLTDLYNNGFFGETMLIYRTSILKEYPFPLFDGETFIPEAVVFDKIDQKYPLHILPEILMICEYQNDGLSNSIKSLRTDNPHGWLLYYQQRIQLTPYSILRYKYIVHAICFVWYLKSSVFQKIPASQLEIIAGMPAALFLRITNRL